MAGRIWRSIMLGGFGLGVGGLCFLLAARNVDVADAERVFRQSDIAWILTGIGLFGIDLLLRTRRWQAILSHADGIDYGRLARGIVAGYAVNILLPARLGELFRADYTARLTGAPRGMILASIFVERLVDLCTVLILLGAGLTWTGIRSATFERVVAGGGGLLVIGILIVCCAISPGVRQRIGHVVRTAAIGLLNESLALRLVATVRNFASLLDVVRTRYFAVALWLTVPIWVLEALSVYSVCRAVGLSLGPVPLMVLLGGASLSTLFPTAPGFIGSYQFAFVVILGSFGISDTLAVVAATSVQLFLMGLYAIVGLVVWSSSSRVLWRACSRT
jgi:uncharacterized protein (TIRG00374 family)